MKTTVEISDPLLREARKLAAREGVTLRALVERGLRRVVSEAKEQKKPFKMRHVTYGGGGLAPEYRDAPFSKILEDLYDEEADRILGRP